MSQATQTVEEKKERLKAAEERRKLIKATIVRG